MNTRLRSSLRGALLAIACAAWAVPAHAQCEITGATVICPGSSLVLCAPPSGGYRWVDENGNIVSTAQCLTVTAPGTYRVSTYDPNFDWWWGPCPHTVSAAPPESCGVEPPPPPPPPPAPSLDTLACPLPASFWSRQCRPEHARAAQLRPAEMAEVGACVDERSKLFAWEDAGAGLCRVMGQSENADLRRRTHRQYAAVLANLCAREAGMARRGGEVFGLGADAGFSAPGRAITVGAWAAEADAELVRLRDASLKDRGVRDAYRRVFAEAWAIGHGVGLGTNCPLADEDGEAEDASLLAALGEDEPAAVAAAPAPVAMPNPFRGAMRFAFTVPSGAGADVDVSVFDLAGRRMATLARGRFEPGAHVVPWDGRSADGSRARAGMYFVRGRIGQDEVRTAVMKVE